MQNACQVKKLTPCQRFTGCHDVIQLSFVILQMANYTMSVGRKKDWVMADSSTVWLLIARTGSAFYPPIFFLFKSTHALSGHASSKKHLFHILLSVSKKF